MVIFGLTVLVRLGITFDFSIGFLSNITKVTSCAEKTKHTSPGIKDTNQP